MNNFFPTHSNTVKVSVTTKLQKMAAKVAAGAAACAMRNMKTGEKVKLGASPRTFNQSITSFAGRFLVPLSFLLLLLHALLRRACDRQDPFCAHGFPRCAPFVKVEITRTVPYRPPAPDLDMQRASGAKSFRGAKPRHREITCTHSGSALRSHQRAT